MTDSGDGIEAARAALARSDGAEARHILTPLLLADRNGLAALLLARLELKQGNAAAVLRLLGGFLEAQPRHTGGWLLRARACLALGALDEAEGALAAARAISPEAEALRRATDEVAAARDAVAARKSIDIIDEGYLAARANGPSDAMRDAARALAALSPGDNWNNDPVAAKIAYFRHAADPVAALRDYDAYLIELSVELDYITWPKRIQDVVKGKAVLDVGCGFGGYGMGFLVAGAIRYTGLDPDMKLDSRRARNKRVRRWVDMACTPREIAAALPAIRLLEGSFEDLALSDTYDAISLHNVTEHLIQLDEVFAGLAPLCGADTKVVYLHHNFYCWNGHHLDPAHPDQLNESNPFHLQVCDWGHIALFRDLPADHCMSRYLNQVRLDEIRRVTDRYFDVLTWDEIPSSKETLARLTPEIVARVRGVIPDIQERELTTNVVFCVARPKAA